MTIHWTRCDSYQEAKDFTGIIYVYFWPGEKPFYWGIAHGSYFGGHQRKVAGTDQKRSGRYSNSYSHWIEGCLQHGAKLYIGQVGKKDLEHIEIIENHLINTFGHQRNRKITPGVFVESLIHQGEVPDFIK